MFGYLSALGLQGLVFILFQGALQTGWEQMSVVYIVTSRLVDELRHQQGARGGLRETQMQGFPGNFMRDSGLQEWIDQQGGVVSTMYS